MPHSSGPSFLTCLYQRTPQSTVLNPGLVHSCYEQLECKETGGRERDCASGFHQYSCYLNFPTSYQRSIFRSAIQLNMVHATESRFKPPNIPRQGRRSHPCTPLLPRHCLGVRQQNGEPLQGSCKEKGSKRDFCTYAGYPKQCWAYAAAKELALGRAFQLRGGV